MIFIGTATNDSKILVKATPAHLQRPSEHSVNELIHRYYIYMCCNFL